MSLSRSGDAEAQLPGPKPDYSVEITTAIAVVVILGAWGLTWLLEAWQWLR